MIRSVLDRPGAPLPENGRAAKPVMLSLLMLAVFSFLIHLLAYVEFIAPGYIPVSDEDPYCFALLFVAILVFLAMLLFSNQNSRFWDGAFLNILVVSVILSFFVYFMVLVWSSMNATYSYALTKMLRRIIKIVAFFTVAMIVYRNDMKATPGIRFRAVLAVHSIEAVPDAAVLRPSPLRRRPHAVPCRHRLSAHRMLDALPAVPHARHHQILFRPPRRALWTRA